MMKWNHVSRQFRVVTIILSLLMPAIGNTNKLNVIILHEAASKAAKKDKYLKVISLLLENAKTGNFRSMLMVGKSYQQLYLKSPQKKYYLDQALLWLKKAAKKDARKAGYILGSIYYIDKYKFKDYKKSLYWFHRAVKNGSLRSLNQLGFIYDKGKGVAIHKKKAELYYLRAVESGSSIALLNLAILYKHMPNTPQNYIRSKKYYKQVHSLNKKRGESVAFDTKHDIALLHYKYKKFSLACNTWKALADKGHRGSQYNIGRCYRYGIGYPKDYVKAVHYYQLAYEQGMKSLKKHLIKLRADIEFLKSIKLAGEYFRTIVKVGSRSHCGLVIEVKRPIAKIQTRIGERWLRINQLYPIEVGKMRTCQFVNGQYVVPR